MIKIPALVQSNGITVPSETFPADTVLVQFDGTNFNVYQTGDQLPAGVEFLDTQS